MYFRGLIPGSIQLVNTKNIIVRTNIIEHIIGIINLFWDQSDGAIIPKKIALITMRQNHKHALSGKSLIDPVMNLPQQRKRLFPGQTW